MEQNKHFTIFEFEAIAKKILVKWIQFNSDTVIGPRCVLWSMCLAPTFKVDRTRSRCCETSMTPNAVFWLDSASQIGPKYLRSLSIIDTSMSNIYFENKISIRFWPLIYLYLIFLNLYFMKLIFDRKPSRSYTYLQSPFH